MAKIYDGPSDDKCPLWRSLCSKVCPTCKWQTQIRGKNPNTGQDVDRLDCAIPFQLLIGMEISKNALSGAAATETLTTEVVKAREAPRPRPIAIDYALTSSRP